MCGIFGWQFAPGKTPPRDAMMRVATALGVLNDQRGGDSWGFFLPTSRKVYKDVGCIASHVADISRARSIMAHTRAKTVGNATKENAHPFVFDGIVGAHNGVISNHVELNKRHDRNFEVDSMHIFAHMSEGKDLKELSGWGAIEFVRDSTPDSICMARISSTGSLSIFGTAYGIFWSSDDDHLKAALDSGRIEYMEYEVKPEIEYFVNKGQLFVDKSIKHKLDSVVVTRYGHNGGGYMGGADMHDWFNKKEKMEPWKDDKYWQRDSDKTKAANQLPASADLIGAGPRNACIHGRPIAVTCNDCAVDTVARLQETAKTGEPEGRCAFCRGLIVDSMCIDMCDEKCTGAAKFEALLMTGDL